MPSLFVRISLATMNTIHFKKSSSYPHHEGPMRPKTAQNSKGLVHPPFSDVPESKFSKEKEKEKKKTRKRTAFIT